MVELCLVVLLVSSALHIRGTNIMLNKPTVQSSTSSSYYPSSIANDGYKDDRRTHTDHEQDPYWQGDLLGFYIVHNISVTSSSILASHLQTASIGVSVHDVSCPDGKVTQCGQWPDENLPDQTLVYTCSHTGPVRFIRIWRTDVNDGLGMSEVEVEGEPTRLTGAGYNRVVLKTVSAPITSLTVINVGDCGRMCLRNQPCVAFSFSLSLQPNCLLANDTTMTSDVQWDTFQIRECFPRPICGFF